MTHLEHFSTKTLRNTNQLYMFNGDVRKDDQGKLRVNPQDVFSHSAIAEATTHFLKVKQHEHILLAKKSETPISREYFYIPASADYEYRLEYVRLLPLVLASALLRAIGTERGSFLFYHHLPETQCMPPLESLMENQTIYIHRASIWEGYSGRLYVNNHAYFAHSPIGTLDIAIQKQGNRFKVVKGISSIKPWQSLNGDQPLPELVPLK